MEMSLVVSVLVIATSIWVLSDAANIGVRKGLLQGAADYGPGTWFVFCLLLWIVAFPAYLYMRPRYLAAIKQLQEEPPAPRSGPTVIRPPRSTPLQPRPPMTSDEMQAEADKLAGALIDARRKAAEDAALKRTAKVPTEAPPATIEEVAEQHTYLASTKRTNELLDVLISEIREVRRMVSFFYFLGILWCILIVIGLVGVLVPRLVAGF